MEHIGFDLPELLARSTRCPGCGEDFIARSGILRHLRRCPRCLAVLQAIEVPMDLQEAADRREEEREA
eukprot:3384698-Pyramimonas_sp.AAC.1